MFSVKPFKYNKLKNIFTFHHPLLYHISHNSPTKKSLNYCYNSKNLNFSDLFNQYLIIFVLFTVMTVKNDGFIIKTP